MGNNISSSSRDEANQTSYKSEASGSSQVVPDINVTTADTIQTIEPNVSDAGQTAGPCYTTATSTCRIPRRSTSLYNYPESISRPAVRNPVSSLATDAKKLFNESCYPPDSWIENVSDPESTLCPPTSSSQNITSVHPLTDESTKKSIDQPPNNFNEAGLYTIRSTPSIPFFPDIWDASVAEYSRPPRLPLPIEEDVHTPGSSMLSINDLKVSDSQLTPLETDVKDKPREPGNNDSDNLLRQNSLFSVSSWDEEDVPEDQGESGLVPTVIEWSQPGEKGYVTGAFASWNRKYKLIKNGPSTRKNCLSTVLNLRPGIHYIKFIVDGQIVISDDLPTAVDFNNILVNYIEVPVLTTKDCESGKVTRSRQLSNSPAVPQTSLALSPISSSSHAATTFTNLDRDPPSVLPLVNSQGPDDQKPSDASKKLSLEKSRILEPVPPLDNDVNASTAVSTHSKQVSVKPLSEARDAGEYHPPLGAIATPPPPQSSTSSSIRAPLKPVYPERVYHQQIPQFMLDYAADEHSAQFLRSAKLIKTLAPPPILPTFLDRSILNTAVAPHTDDASVLVVPNHVMLNHLATSSIKQNVLVISVTTRYKRKFLTTIMHKPIDGE